MNLIKNLIATDSFKPGQNKKKLVRLKQITILILIILFALPVYIFIAQQDAEVAAYPLGIDSEYEKIIELNERATATVPIPIESISTGQTQGDKRIIALLVFFQKKGSPMATFSIAKAFVENADKNGFGQHYYILPAISGIESSFGKRIPYDGSTPSYNGWGWSGGSKRSRWSFFNSWEDAAEKISKGLAKGYGTNLKPENMVRSYCPPCARPGSPWVGAVNMYANEIKSIEKNL